MEDSLPRTIENVRLRATIQRTINQVSALVGAVRAPKKKRKPAKKRKKKATRCDKLIFASSLRLEFNYVKPENAFQSLTASQK